MSSTDFLRNFALVAHIDHGKSTLADRLMERAGILPPAEGKAPRIDSMELETEKGVTIKLKAVRLPYERSGRSYILNMIDTPGHADFSYEVSRSLAACEGILLLVDATSGVQAQTLSHFEKARDLGLKIIGVINKIDSPLAQVEEAQRQMRDLGIEGEILQISALEGKGIDEVFDCVVDKIPPPKGLGKDSFRALVFDSSFDRHLGTLAFVRVVDGVLEGKKEGLRVKFLGQQLSTSVKEIGYFSPKRKITPSLQTGEIGYIATGIKDPQLIRVGDTVISLPEEEGISPLPGYEPPQSYVFASLFTQNANFTEFKKALRTLQLEEPAISTAEISSPAFGRGFRVGFLGTFHLEIVAERLRREFDLDLVVTRPTVSFPEGLSKEPWIRLEILTPPQYLSEITKLVVSSRGAVGQVSTLGSRLKVLGELPMMEFVRGFYNALKSVSSGYASFSWEFLEYREADLVELNVMVHGEQVEGLSEVVTKGEAQSVGQERVKKLKDVLPRKQFPYAIQAKAGERIVAREDVPALRKDVTGGLYGGDVTRKRKLLEKQKKGKKKRARFGEVEVPPEAFLV